MPWPRLAVVLAVTALGATVVLVPALHSTVVVTLAALVGAFALCRTFPTVTVVMHMTPLYYEDLQDLHSRHSFALLSAGTTSLLAAAVLNYAVFRFQHSTLSRFELVGMIGGMLSLYSSCHEAIGKVLLKLLHRRKPRPPCSAGHARHAACTVEMRRFADS